MALIVLLGTATAGTAAVQHRQSPYAANEGSEIPSLTPEELQGLRAGEGMGLARAAELNHHPGPKHSLELAQELGLTEDQRQRIRAIFDEMHGEARALGAEIITHTSPERGPGRSPGTTAHSACTAWRDDEVARECPGLRHATSTGEAEELDKELVDVFRASSSDSGVADPTAC